MSKQNTRLVIEDDTVYELDLACLRNRRRRRTRTADKPGVNRQKKK